MGFTGATQLGHGGMSGSLTRRILGALITAAAVSLISASGAEASKAVTVSCGETITADTMLANDLTDCPDHGLEIGADGVTLDLNGHTIDGDEVEPDLCHVEIDCLSGSRQRRRP